MTALHFREKDPRQANKGQPLEDLIILTNNQYRAQRRAVIQKVPTEWVPIRGVRGEIVNAKVEEKAAVDFLGGYRGRSIAFDAKHTVEERIRWDRVESHQASFLEDCRQDGGIAFVLVSYQLRDFYTVPWVFWKLNMDEWQAKGRGKGASVPLGLLADFKVKPGGRVAVDYLATVDKLFGPGGPFHESQAWQRLEWWAPGFPNTEE